MQQYTAASPSVIEPVALPDSFLDVAALIAVEGDAKLVAEMTGRTEVEVVQSAIGNFDYAAEQMKGRLMLGLMKVLPDLERHLVESMDKLPLVQAARMYEGLLDIMMRHKPAGENAGNSGNQVAIQVVYSDGQGRAESPYA